jgi:hypothetical protein
MAEPPTQCPICDSPHISRAPLTGDRETIGCGQCSHYEISRNALRKLETADQPKKKKLFQWIFDHQAIGESPVINTQNLDVIFSRPPKSFSETVENFLIELDKKTGEFGELFPRSEQRLVQASGTFDREAYQYLIKYLQDASLISIHPDHTGSRIALSPLGLEKVEKIKAINPESLQAFVAMWFSNELDSAWKEGFKKGIAAAGYRAVRIDQKEHANKICDEIIAEIRRSRFVVADFTGQRGGVYYEGGFASGLGLSVINTCRKDHMVNLHFDIRQYNCIDWEKEAELCHRLQARIEAVIGEGPLK